MAIFAVAEALKVDQPSENTYPDSAHGWDHLAGLLERYPDIDIAHRGALFYDWMWKHLPRVVGLIVTAEERFPRPEPTE